MRLPESVIGAMKGIGGAALIAAVAVGCGATQPPMKPTTPAPGVIAMTDPPEPRVQPQPVPVVNPQPEPIVPDDMDMAACGRG